jgi:serine/threonine-protein kinase RsbW
MTETHQPSAVVRAYVGALPADEWFGRQAILNQLTRRLRQAPGRAPQAVALLGPSGAGKSELLRQTAAAWSDPHAELTPVYLNLGGHGERRGIGEDALPVGDGGVWSGLLLQSLAQLLHAAGHLSPADLTPPSASAARLREICDGSPWRQLAERATASLTGGQDVVGAFNGFIRDAATLGLPRLVLLIDGLSRLVATDARAWLDAIAPTARRHGCSLLIEAPADPAAAGLWTAGEIEPIALSPLATEDAVALIQRTAYRRGTRLEALHCLPVCERLGPWPGWLGDWVRTAPSEAPDTHPRRLAERAYVDLVADSPWARHLDERFEAGVPLAAREAALRLVARAAGGGETLSAADAIALLMTAADDAERVLRALTTLGLLTPAGPRWSGPAEPALADWAALRIAPETLQGDLAGARAAMLTSLLIQPPPAVAADAAGTASRLLPEILELFEGQTLPEVLFKFYDYYEAVGRLDALQRRRAVTQSNRTLRVPEVVGVAGLGTFESQSGAREAVFHARAFSEGKYQRQHEELWIAADLSATRSLTTPEIQAALEHADRLRRRLAAPSCRLWLAVGESASADAIELLRRERILCSNLEQLSMLRELLAEGHGRSAPGQDSSGQIGGPTESADSAAGHEAKPAQAPPRETAAPSGAGAAGTGASAGHGRGVIDMQPAEIAPQGEVTLLRLPAREDSEYIAALMAEKVAIRADFPLVESGKIKTAVLEGVLNAIEHSPNPEKLIDIRFRLSPEALEIVIENEGPGFDPLGVPEPDARAKLLAGNKRGWGITLMKKFMDEVDYEPCGRGTRLRLAKRRVGNGAAEAGRQARPNSS